jgi:hypothetical protein
MWFPLLEALTSMARRFGVWAFNGSAWQKVDGGDTGAFTDVTVGNLTITSTLAANLTATANATFATSSLPLVPEGYITVTINGANKKVPYYGV